MPTDIVDVMPNAKGGQTMMSHPCWCMTLLFRRAFGRTFPHISTIVEIQKLVLGGTKNKLVLLIPLRSVHVSQISIVGCYLMGPHCSHCLRLVKWRTCLCSCCQFTFHPHNIIIAELLAMGGSEYQGHMKFIWKLSRSVLTRRGRSFSG